MANAKKRYGNKIELFADGMDALPKSDGLLVLTEWNEFRSPNFEEIKKSLNQPVIFDGRNVYEPSVIRKYGFTYYCIGRDKA